MRYGNQRIPLSSGTFELFCFYSQGKAQLIDQQNCRLNGKSFANEIRNNREFTLRVIRQTANAKQRKILRNQAIQSK